MGDIMTSSLQQLQGLGTGKPLFFLSLFQWMIHPLLVSGDITTQDASRNGNAGPLNISDLCPGVEYLQKFNTTNTTVLQVNTSGCWPSTLPDFTAHQGVVYGACGDHDHYCRLHVEVMQGMFVRVRIQRLGYWCGSRQWHMSLERSQSYSLNCFQYSSDDMFFDTSSNHLFMFHVNFPLVKISIEAVKDRGFLVKYLSPLSGYMILPQQYLYQVISLEYWADLRAPSTHVIMVSFRSTYPPEIIQECVSCTQLIYREPKTNTTCSASVSNAYYTPPGVFPTSHLQIHVTILRTRAFGSNQNGLKMLFSFHSETNQPQKLHRGLFNCSVDHYSSLQHHLDCNLRTECEDGQDETEHCPFSGPGCQGLVASRDKCFHHVRLNMSKISYQMVTYECRKRGGNLASIKTRNERNEFLQMFKKYQKFEVAVGLTSGWHDVPFIYSLFRKWSDETLIYNAYYTENRPYYPKRTTTIWSFHSVRNINKFSENIWQNEITEFICETKPEPHNVTTTQNIKIVHINAAVFSSTYIKSSVSVCSEGHVTHTFLSCDPESHCGKLIYSRFCTLWTTRAKTSTSILPGNVTEYTADMFVCDDDITTVPYTLVCDFRQDCPDYSDESFCEHPACDGFLCSNGQCVLTSQRCNERSDCLDDSDEINCRQNYSPRVQNAEKSQRLLINLDGSGYFTQQVIYSDGSCPDTHYFCTAEWLYCLPVFTRCNGYFDCIYGEDEKDCETVTCPGFYRCRGSSVCVHADHLCDGWGQCPQRDDEWLCDMTCPEDCLCQGHSFLCSKPFSAHLFPHLRYVDATGSGMTLTDFSSKTYIIRLSLSNCNLLNVSNMLLSNLQFLNLANNQIRIVNVNIFLRLLNLRVLILANNPLMHVLSDHSNETNIVLRKLDISKTFLQVLITDLPMRLSQLRHLNVSFSSIETIPPTGFKNLPQLKELDMRGNPITQFRVRLFSGLTQLKMVLSSDYRFCCDSLLPKISRDIRCLSPQPVLSSCTKIIASEIYSVWFWLLGVCAILGNLICFGVPFLLKKTFTCHFTIFMVHLQSANVFMGIYMLIHTVANEMFHGVYVHFEKIWTTSVTCKTAFFLSSVSSEMSVFIIWLITLDHVITICFPLSRWRFSSSVTVVVCTVAWCVGILLSLIPFLPGLSHWSFDGQSGLCHQALSHYHNSHRDLHWYIVTIALNCVLCLMIVYGQVTIFRRIPKFGIVVDSTKKSFYCSVHLFRKVAVTDAACWLSFGLTTAMFMGNAASDKVYVAMAMLVLPLNSALNPLLYIWSAATQRRKEAQEQRLLQLLKSRFSLTRKP